MAQLAPAELERRLRVDEHTASLVNRDPAPVTISAHGTAHDALRGVGEIVPQSTTRPPEHYRVVYDFDTLVGRDQLHRPTVVHIDLLANGNYPFSEPVCRVVGIKVPWTPHFDPSWPICLGQGWSSNGQQLLVYLVAHIARLLNFDEPAPGNGYHGYNAAAIDWWMNVHRCRPLNPDLLYPQVDPNAAAGAAPTRFGRAGGRFSRVVAPTLLLAQPPVASAAGQQRVVFAPVASVAPVAPLTPQAGRFRPVGRA